MPRGSRDFACAKNLCNLFADLLLYRVGSRTMANLCLQCGAALSDGMAEGLCPACLLKHGFASGTMSQQGKDTFVPPSPADLNRHFPQLEILELLGQGGMGAVYKARQKELDRFVALKILPPNAGRDPGFAERFSREAKALAKLNHPNIVAIHDFGQTDGIYWVMMEYVDGVNLRQLLRSRKIAPREALAIVPQICDALQYAHDEGIVHRDIKPENILLDTKGRVKIADFGLAKILRSQPADFTLTDTGATMGTPHYMAPEQVEKPQEVDHRADIYSLGVVFYEMLTGELPLGRFAPPSRIIRMDVRLDEVVLRALEKEPERRYQHASEVKTVVGTIVATPEQNGAGSIAAAFGRQRGGSKSSATRFGRGFRWKLSVSILVVLLVLGARAFVLAPFRVVNDAVSPDIPLGSRVLVFKLARSYAPPDVIVYRHDGRNMLGRVAQPGPENGWLLIARRNEPPQSIPASEIVGRVVLNTRAALQQNQNEKNIPAAPLTSGPASEHVLLEFDWTNMVTTGKLLGGVPVQMEGCAVLKIENTNSSPLQLTLFKIEKPPITSLGYAIEGEIRYENIAGNGYLEMWNYFPSLKPGLHEGPFFTRTLAEDGSGPMSKIAGTSDWRAFSLPFDRTGQTNPPTRLEFNIFLPGRGIVFLRRTRLTQSAGLERRYAQNQSLDIQPDGSVRLKTMIATRNLSSESLQNPKIAARYMSCENHAGAGCFWVDTTMGKIWWAAPGKSKVEWQYLGQVQDAKSGDVGTYVPQANKNGAGLFVLNTVTGEGWWTNGKEWKAFGKPR